MKHLDLFSGIGGFSLALDRVWHEEKNEHTFVEWDDFCTEVLKKHWPEAEYHKDIRRFVADSNSGKPTRNKGEILEAEEVSGIYRETLRSRGTSGTHTNDEQSTRVDILTGGFPCQPFSQAGRRKGTNDDRYLWPAMLDCITLFKPRWVIAENVSGLATWNDGLVLETVCSDMEKEGYEVQPFRIPACAVGAPHRRDRWWFVAHRNDSGSGTPERGTITHGSEDSEKREHALGGTHGQDSNAPNTKRARYKGDRERRRNRAGQRGLCYREGSEERPDWSLDWLEVATRLCGVFNGLRTGVDETMSDGVYLGHAKTLNHIEGQDLPCLWNYIQSEAFQWSAGRFNAVQNKDYLFSILWQHAHRADGQDNLPFESAEVQEAFMRNVWHTDEAGCPPQGWRYNKQYAEKHKDALSSMSHEVALVAEEVWRTYLKDRNPRLKALGNAIVPQVAEEIMRAIKQVDIP